MVYKHKLLSITTLALAGLLTFVMASAFHVDNKISAPLSDLPDAFMEDVVALVFDLQGKPKMKIVAPKMVHFAKKDTTQLTTPQLTLYRKSPIPWYITSKYAEATEGADHVNFWEDVMVQHAADQHNPATVIKTSTLTVLPNAETAETNEAITMIQPNIVIKGVGMRADMNSGDIQLLSQTRGEYVPNS